MTSPSADERRWYDWILNVIAAVIVFFVWHLAAVGMSKWLGGSEGDYFVSIVAMSVALHLHKVERS